MTIRSLVLPAALLLAACGPAAERPLQGYAEGEYVRVASPFAGNLTRLDVQRGTQVKPGAPLFALESENEVAARREADERVKRAEAQLDNLRTGKRAPELDAIRAQLDQAETSLRLSTTEYARQQDLVAKNFVSKQALDQARAALDRDRGRVTELKAQLATAQLAARPDELRAAEFEVSASRQALAQADWRLKQKSALSTVAGVVTDTNFVAGEWVPAGAPVVAILPPENIKVRFFVPEPKLGAIKLGQAVTLACDGCAAPIDAKVSFIAPQAEFTPPVIYSKDSRAKLVFLVEARPAPADAPKLKPGQPVDVTPK
jgi:HlyD family secretion protein